MGIQCSKRKERQLENVIITKTPNTQLKSLSTTKEALDYCDSISLANLMRTKPIKTYIAEQIEKQQIYLDSCDKLAERIEAKSQVILRSYNHFTEKALKIKLKVIDFYKNDYQTYMNANSDTPQNLQLIQKETIQLLVETTIILNSLMDKNFDDETEVWWGNGYFDDRINKLALADSLENQDNIVSPISSYISALKHRINQIVPAVTAQPKSIANSAAVANVHLTQFYKDLKLEFVKQADDEEIIS